MCVCVCVLYLEAQCSSDQCVCRLDAVRLGVLGAVAVWESLQIETRKEIHRCGGVHQRAAGRDAHHLDDTGSHTHTQITALQLQRTSLQRKHCAC